MSHTPLWDQLLALLPIGAVVAELRDAGDDASLHIVFMNDAAARLTNVDVTAHIGRPLLEAFPDIPPERLRLYADVCRKREIHEFGEILLGTAARGMTAFTITAFPVLERGVAIVFENVGMLRRAETEARNLSGFLDSILEHLPAMVFLKNADTLKFERFNRAGEELLGISRDALLGKSDYDFFPREQADFFVSKDREVLRTRTLEDIPEEPIDTPRGTRWLHTRKIPILDARGEPLYLLGVSVDITERRRAQELLLESNARLEHSVAERTDELRRQIDERLRAEQALAQTEEQLRQSQRLEAIGRLAGGVAHDFNNMLSVVLGYSESMLRKLHASDPLREELEEIHRAGVKAADLTRQLLAFSRQQVLQPRVLDLGEVVRGMERMLPRVLGEDVRISIRSAQNLDPVEADPGQMEQVLMNLVVNSRDAMPTGGQLTIETANVTLDEDYAASHLGAHAGRYVMLAVSDTGVGMDRDTLTRVFDPFFTTKETGQGTGLGLSTVFGIVKQSGGSIRVDSEPGRGASFKVYIPISQPGLIDDRRPAVSSIDPRGTEMVLLVEDDEPLRVLVASQLRRFGYRVIACRSGAEALAMSSTQPVQLLLTDVVMPDMDGRALAEALTRRHPEARVLFMSGYTDDAVVRHGVLESSVAFLQKPFSPEALARRVREVLETGPVRPDR